MNFNIIYENLNKGSYDTNKLVVPNTPALNPGYVKDESQSAKWNREYVEKFNAQVKEEKDAYRTLYRSIIRSFEQDLVESIIDYMNYNISLTEGKANIIFNYAYAEAHSDGYYAVVDKAYEICELFSNVL